MRKAINIRGGHCSGKTSAVREFINRRGGTVETIDAGKYKSDITLVSGGIVVLGRYDNGGCEGCDRYKSFDQIKKTIVAVTKKYQPQAIIFEGIMLSVVFKGAYEIATLCKSIGYDYTAILLERDREQRYEYLMARNGGKTVNVVAFENKVKNAAVTARKLAEAGEKVKRVNVTNMTFAQLGSIIEGVLHG